MIKLHPAIEDLRHKLEAFGALAGAGCRWKVCSGGAVLPEPELPSERTRHDDLFCCRIKEVSGGQERCTYNDGSLLYERICTEAGGFVHCCHAGAAEVVVPIRIGGECVGIVMAGPYRPAGRTTGRTCEEAREEFDALPELTSAVSEAIIEFAPGVFGDVVRRIYLESADVLTMPPSDERIVHVLEYLRKNLPAAPTVAEVAAEAYLSSSRLLHLFKAECGIGLGEYILKLRLREARRYLLTDEAPISEVAAAAGFSDQSHFSALFRREFGLPPLQYRRRYGRRR